MAFEAGSILVTLEDNHWMGPECFGDFSIVISIADKQGLGWIDGMVAEKILSADRRRAGVGIRRCWLNPSGGEVEALLLGWFAWCGSDVRTDEASRQRRSASPVGLASSDAKVVAASRPRLKPSAQTFAVVSNSGDRVQFLLNE